MSQHIMHIVGIIPVSPFITHEKLPKHTLCGIPPTPIYDCLQLLSLHDVRQG